MELKVRAMAYFWGGLVLLLEGGFEWLRDSGLEGCVSLEV